MNKQKLSNNRQRIIEHLVEELSKDPNIIFAYMFGSFTLKSIPHRDIDVGIFLKESTSPLMGEKYEINLAVTLEKLFACHVDVVILNQAPLSIQYHITREKLIFCRNMNLHFDFLEKIWRDYFDFKPLARQMLFEILSQ